jgi:predicted tellurium resistance membrane protein TerC
VWFGHVAVRRIEFVSPTIWIPSTVFAILGLAAEIFSLSTVNRPLSTIFGILGITLLFDAFELIRQQKRVKKGHAPANPANPRHAKILAAYSSATTLDLLKRDPTGELVTPEQAARLVTEQ